MFLRKMNSAQQGSTNVFILPADIALPATVPQPCTLRHLVTNYLDINSIPRRSLFKLLWHFTEDEMEKEKFEEFTSAEGQV